jgi:hypothetical protein
MVADITTSVKLTEPFPVEGSETIGKNNPFTFLDFK